MWTTKNRARYDRSKLRYPSDLTDEEWQLVEPLIPPGKPGGDKRTVVLREVVNGLMYILSTGCQWRAIPKDLPPKSTVYDYFDLWTYDGNSVARVWPTSKPCKGWPSAHRLRRLTALTGLAARPLLVTKRSTVGSG